MRRVLTSIVSLPAGFAAAGVRAGVKPRGGLDLGLLVAERAAPAAAVFTRNSLLGAHIPVCREHLERSEPAVAGLIHRGLKRLRSLMQE